MSALENQLKEISSALEELRATPAEGPNTRKALDSLFRRTHNLKAAAAAEGLSELSRAAHEMENILHALRAGSSSLNEQTLQELTEKSTEISAKLPVVPAEIWNSLKAEERHALSQAVKEGADLFLVQTSFDVADFDQRFQTLKEILLKNGELISITPRTEHNKINFQIVYARDQTAGELTELANVTVAKLSQRETISFIAVVQRAIRAGRSAALALNKEIDFESSGEDLLLPDSLCNTIADPLMHLVRNAVDHGIEHDGKITIEATRSNEELTIKVTDNGRGISPETIRHLFEPGFSTATKVSELSGRGVGLDIVKTAIEDAGGSINVTSQLCHGATFVLTLPLASN